MAEPHSNSIQTSSTNRPGFVAPTPVQIPAPVMADASASRAHVNLERCRLSLIKGEHRWRFRWEPGSEAAVISAVADLARNPHVSFDWFDAAVVCRHIAQGLPANAELQASAGRESAASAHRADSPPQK